MAGEGHDFGNSGGSKSQNVKATACKSMAFLAIILKESLPKVELVPGSL